MTFEQLWAVIRRRWILIIGCCLLAGLGALGVSSLLKPLYQSSVIVQVMVGSSTIDQANYDGLLASQQLAQTEATLATSSSILGVVASHHYGLTASQIASEVSATPKTNTSLFEIDVLDASPSTAATLANDIAATLIEQQTQVTQRTNAQALQHIQSQLDTLSKQIDATTTQIAQVQAKINSQSPLSDPNDKTQLALLQTQLTQLQQSYNTWQASLIQLQLTQAQNGNPLSVVQFAFPAASPAQPNTKLNTGGGLLAGLLLGLLLALLVDSLDTRVRTAEELTKVLGWPILATIWQIKSAQAKSMLNPTSADINTEQFRILRTNLGFAGMDQPLRSLIVTSASPQEGKSSIAANLAIFMAKAGKNTLLIDADLRRPFQHTLFKLTPHALGLSNAVLAFNIATKARTTLTRQVRSMRNALADQQSQVAASFSLAPFAHAVDIPNLRVMPAGPLPPDPSEFLESKPMQQFLALLEESGIDVIILDTPPLVGLSDSSILAAKVDGALVVVDATKATRKKLEQLKRTLTQTGVRVPGYVANRLKHTRRDDTYLYYMESQLEDEALHEEIEEAPQSVKQAPDLATGLAPVEQLPAPVKEPENEEAVSSLSEDEGEVPIEAESLFKEEPTQKLTPLVAIQVNSAEVNDEEASDEESSVEAQEASSRAFDQSAANDQASSSQVPGAMLNDQPARSEKEAIAAKPTTLLAEEETIAFEPSTDLTMQTLPRPKRKKNAEDQNAFAGTAKNEE